MSNKLKNIVKISEENYRILEDGGSVKGHSYDPSSLYLVEDNKEYATKEDLELLGDLSNLEDKFIKRLRVGASNSEIIIADPTMHAYIGYAEEGDNEMVSYLGWTQASTYLHSKLPLKIDSSDEINISSPENIRIGSGTNVYIGTDEKLFYNNKEVATVDLIPQKFVDLASDQKIYGIKNFAGTVTGNECILKNAGSNVLKVVRRVSDYCNLNLIEAKKLVNNLPQTISLTNSQEVFDFKNEVESASEGALVEISFSTKSLFYNNKEVATIDDIPTIPTNVSEFTNDAGYLTEHLSLSNYLTKDLASLTYQPKGNYALSSNIPTKVSLLTNDSGYLTQHQSLSGYIPFGKALLTKNSFASQKDLYISKLDNSLYAANSRYIVTHQAFDENGNKIANLNTGLFDCDYEHAQTLSASLQPSYAEVYIGVVAEDNLETTTSQFRTHGSGYLFLSFYNIWYPSPEDVEVWGYVKEHSSGQTRGWKKLGNAETYGNKSVLRISTSAIATYPVAIKIKYACKRHSGNYITSLCQVEWFGTRCSANYEAGITKYPYAQTMYGNLTAPKFIVNGGKSTQFLKADGSLDSTTYVNSGTSLTMSAILTDGTTKTYTIYGKEN